MKELPANKVALVKEKLTRLHAELLDGTLKNESDAEKRERGRELAIAVQTIPLDAARQEVVAARSEPGMDPSVADRVLRQLDSAPWRCRIIGPRLRETAGAARRA